MPEAADAPTTRAATGLRRHKMTNCSTDDFNSQTSRRGLGGVLCVRARARAIEDGGDPK